MVYREFLVMRKAVLWYVLGGFGLSLLVYALSGSFVHGGQRPQTTGEFGELLEPAAFATAMAFAAIFGVALGNASREPARVLWLFPESRLRSALAIIAVDFVGIALVFFGLTAAFLGAAAIFAALGLLDVRITWTIAPWTLPRLLGLCFAAYGWCALAGMLLRRVPYAGIVALPALLMLQVFGNLNSLVGQIVRILCLANPWIIVNAFRIEHYTTPSLLYRSLMWVTEASATGILYAIAIGTCGLAVLLWQRAEVIA
jgi:hypothetical protein